MSNSQLGRGCFCCLAAVLCLFPLAAKAGDHPTAAAPPQGEELTVPGGTLIRLGLVDETGTRRAKEGDSVRFRLLDDLWFSGDLYVPRGARATGLVVRVKKPGRLARRSRLALQLTHIELLNGQRVEVSAKPMRFKGGSTFLRKLRGAGEIAAGQATGVSSATLVGAVHVVRRGPHVVLPPGTVVTARLSGDLVLPEPAGGWSGLRRRSEGAP